MLSYTKSATARPGDRLNGLENGKTQQLENEPIFKKVECSFNTSHFSIGMARLEPQQGGTI